MYLNKEDNYIDIIKKPSKIGMVVSYILIFVIGSSILMSLLAFLVAKKYDVSAMSLVSYLAGQINDEIYKIPASKLNAYTMFIAYGFTVLFVGFYGRNYLRDDFKKLMKNKWWKNLLLIIILAGGFYLISFLVEKLIRMAIGQNDSLNQTLIEEMVKFGSPTLSFFAVVVFAPLVEELIFRKVIFEYGNKISIVLSYVISSLVFGLMHMVSTTDVTIGVWLLLGLSYISSGVLLCVVYHLSGQNIYISTIAHILNNLLSFIFIMI